MQQNSPYETLLNDATPFFLSYATRYEFFQSCNKLATWNTSLNSHVVQCDKVFNLQHEKFKTYASARYVFGFFKLMPQCVLQSNIFQICNMVSVFFTVHVVRDGLPVQAV